MNDLEIDIIDIDIIIELDNIENEIIIEEYKNKIEKELR